MAEQDKKAAQEDHNSRVTFEVEVLHFQAYLQAEMAPGAFLLAAQKGRVEGRSLPHLLQNLITLTLDQASPPGNQSKLQNSSCCLLSAVGSHCHRDLLRCCLICFTFQPYRHVAPVVASPRGTQG